MSVFKIPTGLALYAGKQAVLKLPPIVVCIEKLLAEWQSLRLEENTSARKCVPGRPETRREEPQRPTSRQHGHTACS